MTSRVWRNNQTRAWFSSTMPSVNTPKLYVAAIQLQMRVVCPIGHAFFVQWAMLWQPFYFWMGWHMVCEHWVPFYVYRTGLSCTFNCQPVINAGSFIKINRISNLKPVSPTIYDDCPVSGNLFLLYDGTVGSFKITGGEVFKLYIPYFKNGLHCFPLVLKLCSRSLILFYQNWATGRTFLLVHRIRQEGKHSW